MDESRARLRDHATMAFDYLHAAVIVLTPLCMGARGDFGKFVFISLVLGLTLVWSLRCIARPQWKARWTGAEWIIFGGVALLIVQLVPLPVTLLKTLSPALSELLPIWFAQPDSASSFQWGQWHCLSLSPEYTRRSLAVFLAYSIFFLLTVDRIDSLHDAKRLLRWIGNATLMLALLAMTQFLFGNEKFLWVFEHPSRITSDVIKGPFQNQNHFAHMMALGVGPLIWMLVAAMSDSQSHMQPRGPMDGKARGHLSVEAMFQGFALGFVTLATMLTFSRGGFLAFITAASIVIAIYYWQAVWRRGLLPMSLGIAAVVLVALCIHGYERLSTKLATFKDSRSLEQLSSGRHALWESMATSTKQFWLTGTGFGSHQDVYPIHLKQHFNVKFTHGESGYFPLAMEGGVFAVALLGAAVVLVGRWIWPSLRKRLGSHQSGTRQSESERASTSPNANQRPIASSSQNARARKGRSCNHGMISHNATILAAPILAAVVASLLHSLGDFVWYISACMVWTLVMLAVAARLPELDAETSGDATSRTSRAASTAGSQPSGRERERITDNRGDLIGSHSPLVFGGMSLACLFFATSTFFGPARASLAWNQYLVVVNNPDLSPELKSDLTESWLRKTIACDPMHPRAHLLLARLASEQRYQDKPGEQPALSQMLYHAGKVAMNFPLRGTSYALLATSDSIKGNPRLVQALTEQALVVRPHDATIRFHLGQLLISKGKIQQGFEHWRVAFENDPQVRNTLAAQLCALFPAPFLVDQLQPGIDGLRALEHAYRSLNQPDNTNLLYVSGQMVIQLDAEINATADPHQQARLYFERSQLNKRLAQHDACVDDLKQAIVNQPDVRSYHQHLARQYYDLGQYDAAIEQAQWCLNRDPQDETSVRLLADATRLKITRSVSTQSDNPDSPDNLNIVR